MFARVCRLIRASLIASARHVPVLGPTLRARDNFQRENGLLRARLSEVEAARDAAERARWAAVGEREEAERTRWAAVAERDAAERARWAAVAERDEAERARSAVLAERDEADHARCTALGARDEAERARLAAVAERDEAERARSAAVAERDEAERARSAAVAKRDDIDEALRDVSAKLDKLEGARRSVVMTYEDALRRLERRRADAADNPKPEQRKAAEVQRSPIVQGVSGAPRAGEPAQPKISVLLPNFNHGAFIRDNIEGLLAQTYKNWELVVVDDGSTDNSRDIIQSFAKLDTRIITVFLPENRGVSFAIKAGMAMTSGSLFSGSAADDYVQNDRFFETAIAALDEHPKAAGVFGKAVIIDPVSKAELWTMGSAPLPGLIPPRLALEAFLSGRMFVPGSSAIWRRSEMDALGGFDDALGPQTDYFINHALPAVSGVVFVDQVFTAVRTSEGSYHQSADDEDFFRRHALVEKKLRSLNLPIAIEADWFRVWREGVINGRFAAQYQQVFFDSVRSALDRIESWEQRALPKSFSDHLARFEAEQTRLQDALSVKMARAREIFETIAGVLSPEQKPAGVLQDHSAGS